VISKFNSVVTFSTVPYPQKTAQEIQKTSRQIDGSKTPVSKPQRILAFRCNAFEEDPDWEELDASSMLEAEQGVFGWVNRN
jgi:hypothetical protein